MATKSLKQLEKMGVKEVVGARKRNAITSSANTAHNGTFDSYPSGATKDKTAINRKVNAISSATGKGGLEVANKLSKKRK